MTVQTSDTTPLLVVVVTEIHLALPAQQVIEVLPAARPTPLPGAPDSVIGVLNVRGEPVVVVDGAACLGHPSGGMRASHRLVVVRAAGLLCALRVDRADDLITVADEDLVSRPLVVSPTGSAKVAVLPDGVLAVHDVASFVSTADAVAIRRALEALVGAG